MYKRKDKTFMVDHIVVQLSQIHFSSVENGTAAAKTPEITYNIYVIYICTFFVQLRFCYIFNPFSLRHLFCPSYYTLLSRKAQESKRVSILYEYKQYTVYVPIVR